MKKFIAIVAVAALAACSTTTPRNKDCPANMTSSAAASRVAAEQAAARAQAAEQKAIKANEKNDRIFEKSSHK